MGACLISITGTSGTIRLNYTLSGTPYVIETSKGSLYIESTATSVTYTTLEGDLVASSSCLTVTNLPSSCYTISWNNINTNGYVINAIILGATTISIPSISFPNSTFELVSAINNLYNDKVKVVGHKFVTEAGTYQYNNSYIFKVLGADIPILRLYNSTTNTYLYIYGVASSCTISEYTQVVPCYTAPIPMTTTTTTTTTSTTTTTTTIPPVQNNCFSYSGTVTSGQIVDSTGNSNQALDGLIFLDYRVCPSGNLTSVVYTSPQSITVCGYSVEFYYYKNNVKTYITGNLTMGGSC